MARRDDIEDPNWIAYAKACIARLETIRDAFLEGRDPEAVRMIRDEDPRGDRTVLGIESSDPMYPAEAALICARPQVPFRADRFCVDEAVAGDFVVNDIRLGNRSMFVQSSDVAGSIFSSRVKLDALKPVLDAQGFWTIKINAPLEDLLGVAIDFPVCEVGQELLVQVTNVSTQNVMFRGAFFGRVVGGRR